MFINSYYWLLMVIEYYPTLVYMDTDGYGMLSIVIDGH